MSSTDAQVSPRRSVVVLKAAGAVITVLLAILGAITGTIAWRQDRRTAVELYALPFLGPKLDDGLIRFSIVNQSRHAVSISRGEVWLEGRKIGVLEYLIPNVDGTDVFVTRTEELEQKGQILPVGLGGETTTAIAAAWVLTGNRDFATTRLADKNTLPEDTRTVFPSSDLPMPIKASKTPLEIRIRLTPGGERTASVPVLAGIEDVLRGPQDGISTGWTVQLLTRTRVVKAMTITGPRGPAVVTLRLWTRTSNQPIRTIVRPVGSTIGRFDLHGLADGAYVWALSDGDRTIGTGTLVQPCPRISGSISPDDSLGRCSLQLLARRAGRP